MQWKPLGLVVARLCQALPVLLVVGLIAFCLFAFVGDPVTNMLGQNYTEADRVALTHQLGLDQPLLVQYARFMVAVAHGSFGISYRVGRPVWDLFVERLPATVELSATAALFALAAAVPLGVYAGIHPRSAGSRAIMAFSLLGVSLPTFLLGILLVLVFSVHLRWLPSFGRGDTVRLGFWTTGLLTRSGLASLVLPAVTLGLFQLALILRLLRGEMLDVMRSGHIRFARSRGLPERRIHRVHALRNAMAPVIAAVGVQLGGIIAFSIVTEQVFQWPGLGLLLVASIQTADVPVISAYLMAAAVLFLAINLGVDLLQGAVDPRLRDATPSLQHAS